MNLLIIEDNVQISNILVRNFARDYDVDKAYNTSEAMNKIKRNKFDVIILDWFLGNDDGLKFSKKIREVCKVPILMTTVRNDKEDIVRALDKGIDDYLVKPFSLDELSARINNLSQRKKEPSFNKISIKVNKTSLNLKEKKVYVRGKEINLTNLEYRLLALLMVNKNIIISKDEILKYLFDNSSKSHHLVNMHILNLRKKLKNNISIKTIPHEGFVISKK